MKFPKLTTKVTGDLVPSSAMPRVVFHGEKYRYGAASAPQQGAKETYSTSGFRGMGIANISVRRSNMYFIV